MKLWHALLGGVALWAVLFVLDQTAGLVTLTERARRITVAVFAAFTPARAENWIGWGKPIDRWEAVEAFDTLAKCRAWAADRPPLKATCLPYGSQPQQGQ